MRADQAATEVQFPSRRYQDDTALAGMWLFLASETLFFGGLFLSMLYCRHLHPAAWIVATHRTDLVIGTANTAVLLTSSAAMAVATACARADRSSQAARAALLAAALGAVFVGLKAVEWAKDLGEHLLPGASFVAKAADGGGEQLFWLLYWTATILHAVHLLAGIGLCAWLARRLGRVLLTGRMVTTVEIVGLYWSFVDMVWMVMYPLIYLMARR